MQTFKRLCAGLLASLAPLSLQAKPPAAVPPEVQLPAPAPVLPPTIIVTPTAPVAPPVSIILGDRHGHVVPTRRGFQHTAGGNIDVQQPSPDVVVITMSGVTVAGAHLCKESAALMDFDLTECLEISVDNPKAKNIKLTVDGRVVGLLRSHHKVGIAEESAAASVTCGHTALAAISLPSHSVSSGENLSINDFQGPVTVPVGPGKLMLHQTFHVGVHHDCTLFPCKAASAEFAPDPALDPLWISYWEPFHGANKKDFGFRVTLKVTAE